MICQMFQESLARSLMQTMTQSSFLQSHQHTRRPRFWSSVSFCTLNTHIQLKFDQYSCWIISMHKMFHHNNEFETKRAFQGLSTDNECRPTDPTHQSWKTDLTNSERVSEPYNAPFLVLPQCPLLTSRPGARQCSEVASHLASNTFCIERLLHGNKCVRPQHRQRNNHSQRYTYLQNCNGNMETED